MRARTFCSISLFCIVAVAGLDPGGRHKIYFTLLIRNAVSGQFYSGSPDPAFALVGDGPAGKPGGAGWGRGLGMMNAE